jgi:hypothetical protein
VDAPRAWLVLIYKIPTEPARKRTYIWRKLKKLGAIYLQQAAALLPDTRELRAEMENLAERIREYEGDVTVLQSRSTSPGWEQEVIGRFNGQRDEEYAEVAEVALRLIAELDRESQKGKITFAELEENEEGLESLRRWLDQVTARDFFRAPGRPPTEEALGQASTRLQAFGRQVHEQEDR